MTAVSELEKAVRSISTRHHLWRVFDDWIFFCAAALSNAVDLAQKDGREQEYMQRIGQYDRDEAFRFKAAFHLLKDQCEQRGMHDALGTLFMNLELGNAARGQFFTPYEVCRLMARQTIDVGAVRAAWQAGDFTTMGEPAGGSGAMVLAACEYLWEQGVNYQRCFHASLTDIDTRAALMAYVQLSLFYVPAVVTVGNTLSCEVRERWYTPAHIWDGWTLRLKYQHKRNDHVQSAGGCPGNTTEVRGSEHAPAHGDNRGGGLQWGLFDEPGNTSV